MKLVTVEEMREAEKHCGVITTPRIEMRGSHSWSRRLQSAGLGHRYDAAPEGSDVPRPQILGSNCTE